MESSNNLSVPAVPKKRKRHIVYLPAPNDRAYDIQPFLNQFNSLFKDRKELVTTMSDLEDALRALYITDVDPTEIDRFIHIIKFMKIGVARIKMYPLLIGGRTIGH